MTVKPRHEVVLPSSDSPGYTFCRDLAIISQNSSFWHIAQSHCFNEDTDAYKIDLQNAHQNNSFSPNAFRYKDVSVAFRPLTFKYSSAGSPNKYECTMDQEL